jgi:sulfonate transport system substrate-binding protein
VIHRQLLACLVLAFFAVVAHADDTALRFGDSKGVMKALLTAAGELKDVRYRVEWAEFPATAPALKALSAVGSVRPEI